MKGFLCRYDKNKGYGFVTTETGKDLFFHVREADNELFAVEFDVAENERGQRATNVKRINDNNLKEEK